jgi:hypothetical protein
LQAVAVAVVYREFSVEAAEAEAADCCFIAVNQ